MDKMLHPNFPNKDDTWIAKKLRGITLTSIGAKVYNVLLLRWNWKNSVETSVRFLKRPIQYITDYDNTSNRRSLCKKSWDNTIICSVSKVFDSILKGMMEHILLANGTLKKLLQQKWYLIETRKFFTFFTGYWTHTLWSVSSGGEFSEGKLTEDYW